MPAFGKESVANSHSVRIVEAEKKSVNSNERVVIK